MTTKKLPTYKGDQLIVGEHLVSTVSGEVKLTVSTKGTYTPQNDKEREAVELLGARPTGKGE